MCNLAVLSPASLNEVLAAIAVNEVWGVSRRISVQLSESSIHTMLDLSRLDPARMRRRWSVMLDRTASELQGLTCIKLELAPARKREIACTRSFGRPVTHLADLDEAVTEFASRAAHKLRGQGSLASRKRSTVAPSASRCAGPARTRG